MGGSVLALDIGGTKLAAGVVSRAGEVVAEGVAPTDPEATPSGISETLFRLAAEVLRPTGIVFSDLAAVGISFGGPVDYDAGTVVTCHHLAGWEGVPFRDIVSEKTGLPAVMDNDANAAALGETAFGAARGCENVLYVTVSTGIGGGLVIGGRVHRGLNSMAGEIGHTQLVPYGPRCTCGRLGCLESVAAGWAMVRDARAALDGGAASALRGVSPDELSARHIAEMARADPLAGRIMDRAGAYLGMGIARAVTLISPEVVVIGGGISQAGDVLLSPLHRGFERHVMPEVAEGMRIVPGELGPRWGLYGAAALAVRELLTDG